MKKVLVINAGSSTIKWTLFEKVDLKVLAEGLAERIFVDGTLITKINGEKFKREVSLENHRVAANEVVNELINHNLIKSVDEIENIGHRVVQGSDIFKESIILDQDKISTILDLSSLAPLHNPGAVEAINAFKGAVPMAKLSATFDTSFHQTMDQINYSYPIEKKLANKLKIRKYGFHGTSHRYITNKLQEVLKKDKVTFINLHIGNGASLCAIKDSESIDTSMGLTPLAGIMMGTRSGDIDPSIHKYVMDNTDMTIQEFDNILNKESGLKGVSGISSDAREIEEAISSGNQDAIFALDLYVQKIVDYTAIYANKVGGKKEIDAIVFTAGFGENSPLLRRKVISKLKFANLFINESNNNLFGKEVNEITTKESDFPVYSIRTNEELMIALDAIKLDK